MWEALGYGIKLPNSFSIELLNLEDSTCHRSPWFWVPNSSVPPLHFVLWSRISLVSELIFSVRTGLSRLIKNAWMCILLCFLIWLCWVQRWHFNGHCYFYIQLLLYNEVKLVKKWRLFLKSVNNLKCQPKIHLPKWLWFQLRIKNIFHIDRWLEDCFHYSYTLLSTLFSPYHHECLLMTVAEVTAIC